MVSVSEEAEDPASIPIYWVSKWVDYSDKYGLGYQLCDNSVGVLFNDSTRLILLANGEYVIHFVAFTPYYMPYISRFLHGDHFSVFCLLPEQVTHVLL